ncbi:MAG TPA: outer membrane beta-barrel protein [Opitutus sp.]|nr:outer membrane beta-barrel protein [Opitutus sp.]
MKPLRPHFAPGWCHRRGRRLLALAAVLAAPASPLPAALFENEGWAVTTSATASALYADNLFQRRDGDAGGYVAIEPALHVFRQHSLTQLQLDASVRARTFVGVDEPETLDPSLSLLYRYPADPDVLSQEELRASFTRRTDVNRDVGELLRWNTYGADWEGVVLPTGRLTVAGHAGAQREEYDLSVYDIRDRLTAGLTLDLVSTEQLRLGVGYDFVYEFAHCQIAGCEVERIGHAVVFRGSGALLPKLNGKFYAGGENSAYSKRFNRSVWDVIAGASLAWSIDDRADLSLSADRSNYFAANGDAVLRTSVELAYAHRIAKAFRARVQCGVGQARFRADTLFRKDDSVTMGGGLSYRLTQRLEGAIDVAYLRQDSTEERYDFDSLTLQGRLTCNF